MQTFFSNVSVKSKPIQEGTPLNVPTERFTAITPTEGAKILPTDKSGKWVGATPTARFANLPSGMGSYTVDKANMGQLIKTNRPALNESQYQKNFLERAGMPSHSFQIDHIIPLALGGNDTAANKQLLNIKDHTIKTAVGAVAQDLYFNKKMTLPEAQNLVLNWKGKDIGGIKVLDNGGLANPEIALAKVEQWKAVPKVTLKDWWGELGDTWNKIGPAIAKLLPNNTVSELGKGVIAGASGGWINPPEGQYTGSENVVNTGARWAGMAAGGIGTFVAGGWLLDTVKLGITGLDILGGVKVAEEAPVVLEAAAESVDALRGSGYAIKGGGFIKPMDVASRMLRNAGIFGAIGQLSKQEDNSLNARAGRLMSDMTTGALLGSSPSAMTGIGRVMLGAYAVSAVGAAFDDKTTVAEGQINALINAGIVGGLAALGEYTDSKALEDGAMKGAAAILSKWGIEKNVGEALTLDEKEQVFEAIDLFHNSDPDVALQEKVAVIISDNQLARGGLATYARSQAKTKDYLSMSRWLSKDTGPVSKEGMQALKLTETLPMETPHPSDKTTIIGTGFGETASKDANLNVKKLAELYKTNPDAVLNQPIILQVDDRPVIVKQVAGTNNYKFPEKNIRIYGKVDGKTSFLGWVPDINNINNKINPIREQWNLPLMDPNINKDTIFDQMTGAGTRTITGRIKYINGETVTSGNPALSIEITPNDWNNGQTVTNAIKGGVKTKVTTAVGNITQKTNTIAKNAIVNKNIPADSKGFFTNLVNQVDQNIKAGPDQMANYLQGLVNSPLSANAREKIARDAQNWTVHDLVSFFVDHRRAGTLSANGNSIFDLAFNTNTDTYYGNLSDAQRNVINKKLIASPLTDFSKTGEIPQNVPLAPIENPNLPPQQPTPNPVETTTTPPPFTPITDINQLPAKVFQNIRRGKVSEVPRTTTPAVVAKNAISELSTKKTTPTDAEIVATLEKRFASNKNLTTPVKGETNPILEAAKKNKKVEGALNNLDKIRQNLEVPGQTNEDLLHGDIAWEESRPKSGNLTDFERDQLIRQVGVRKKFAIDKISRLQLAAEKYSKDRGVVLDESDGFKNPIEASKYLESNGVDPNEIVGVKMGNLNYSHFTSGKDFVEQIKKSADKSTGMTKVMWNKIVDKLNKRLPGITEGKYKLDTAKLERDYMDEHTAENMAGRQRGINKEVMKYGDIIKAGGKNESYFKKLPQELQNKLAVVRKEYPTTRFTFSQTEVSKYPKSKFYNTYKDVRDTVYPNSPSGEHFDIGKKTLSPQEKEKFPLKLGLEGGQAKEYMGNLRTEAALQEQKTVNFINWLFSPIINKEIGTVGKESATDRLAAINRVTDDIVNRMSSYFEEDKSRFYNPDLKKYSSLLDRIMAEQQQKKGLEAWKNKIKK